MDRIERAYHKKLKLAEFYGVSVTAIVWTGGNRFVIVREGAGHRDTEVIYANGKVSEVCRTFAI